jgi:hypothetical protein
MNNINKGLKFDGNYDYRIHVTDNYNNNIQMNIKQTSYFGEIMRDFHVLTKHVMARMKSITGTSLSGEKIRLFDLKHTYITLFELVPHRMLCNGFVLNITYVY